jgi:hypothetical protein
LVKELGLVVDRNSAKVEAVPAWPGLAVSSPRRTKPNRFTNPRSIARMGKAAGLATNQALKLAAKAIAEQNRVADYALLLRYDVAVYLIRVEKGGALVGYELRYQRLSALGVPLFTTDLEYDLQLG